MQWGNVDRAREPWVGDAVAFARDERSKSNALTRLSTFGIDPCKQIPGARPSDSRLQCGHGREPEYTQLSAVSSARVGTRRFRDPRRSRGAGRDRGTPFPSSGDEFSSRPPESARRAGACAACAALCQGDSSRAIEDGAALSGLCVQLVELELPLQFPARGKYSLQLPISWDRMAGLLGS
jgi:hypothetical protein